MGVRNRNISESRVLRNDVNSHATVTHTATAASFVWSLVPANALTLVVALALDWRLADLTAVYWTQNMIIGVSYFARILGLGELTAEHFRLNDPSGKPAPATKRQTAFFFLAHFGSFQLCYLFLHPWAFHADLGVVMCGVAFAVSHYFAHRRHRELDRQGTPNVVEFMFAPYLRIIPMHLTILFGAAPLASAAGLLFVLLKTVADVMMHFVEHRFLEKSQRSNGAHEVR